MLYYYFTANEWKDLLVPLVAKYKDLFTGQTYHPHKITKKEITNPNTIEIVKKINTYKYVDIIAWFNNDYFVIKNRWDKKRSFLWKQILSKRDYRIKWLSHEDFEKLHMQALFYHNYTVFRAQNMLIIMNIAEEQWTTGIKPKRRRGEKNNYNIWLNKTENILFNQIKMFANRYITLSMDMNLNKDTLKELEQIVDRFDTDKLSQIKSDLDGDANIVKEKIKWHTKLETAINNY